MLFQSEKGASTQLFIHTFRAFPEPGAYICIHIYLEPVGEFAWHLYLPSKSNIRLLSNYQHEFG